MGERTVRSRCAFAVPAASPGISARLLSNFSISSKEIALEIGAASFGPSKRWLKLAQSIEGKASRWAGVVSLDAALGAGSASNFATFGLVARLPKRPCTDIREPECGSLSSGPEAKPVSRSVEIPAVHSALRDHAFCGLLTGESGMRSMAEPVQTYTAV